MGHFGFSYTGLIFLLLLFIPNILWTKHKPEGYTSQGENKILLCFERVGQTLITPCVLIFKDFNLRPWDSGSIWMVVAVICMVLYEIWWVRYFRSPQKLGDYYCSMLGIPVPGAVLPVAAFFLLGFYGRVIWLPICAVILGIGHIGIHLGHRRDFLESDCNV